MDDGGVPAVEFLDGGTSGGVDEELDTTPPGRRSAPMLLAAGVLLLLVGAVVAVRVGGGSGHRPPAAAPTPAARSTAPASPPAAPSPVLGAALELPCPADAECSVWSTAPSGVLTAVRAQFRGAALISATTELVNRAGRFEPDLFARRLTAQSGPYVISVYVRKTEHGNGVRHVVADDSGVRVFAGWPGYLVTVTVDGPGHPTRAAVELAEDARLLIAL